MAKKVKEDAIDFNNINFKDKKKNTRANTKSNSPSKNKKNNLNKKEKKATNSNEDKFNFDNEIVIGVNVIPNGKKDNKNKNNKNDNRNKREKTNKNINQKKLDNEKATTKEDKNRKENKVRIVDEAKYNKSRKIVIVILKMIIILLLAIGVGIFLVTSPMFNITKINVYGNSRISTEQIISLSKIELETNIYKLLKSKVEKNIKENAYIDSVKIQRKLPNQIDIEISERKPQCMLQFGNAYVYIGSQGYMLEISEEKLNTPIIKGYSTKEDELIVGNRLNEVDLQKLEVVLRIIEIATSNEISTYIAEIDISDPNNFTLVMPEKGKTAYLGDNTNLKDKISVLKQILIKSEGTNGEAFLMDKDKMYFREK